MSARSKPKREKFDANHTLTELGQVWSASVRVPQFVGTGASIAAELACWFEEGVCDGFVVSPAVRPRSCTDFVG